MDQRTVILIVDDYAEVRDSLALILISSGYQLIYGESGHESIRKAVSSGPDLIVLNAALPLLNGFDLCRLLKGNDVLGQIPILLIVPKEDFESRRKGLKAAADGLLTVPFDAEEVRMCIHSVLNLNRLKTLPTDIESLFLPRKAAGRHRHQLESLSRRLLQVQEEERRSIARELHDEVGQILTVLKINLVLTQREIRESVDPRLLADSIDLVDRLIGQVRDLWRNLRPSLLDELGLAAALQPLVDWRRSDRALTWNSESDPRLGRLSPDQEITCYRVVQESLTNVIRHSRATRVRVELVEVDGYLDLTISDDGVGFDVDEVYLNATAGSRMGLLGMRERLSPDRRHVHHNLL